MDCALPDFDTRIRDARNVFVGRIRAVVTKARQPQRYTVDIVIRLKDGGLLAGKTSFELEAFTGWDLLRYKKGQLLLFTFGDDVSVRCNFPVVLK